MRIQKTVDSSERNAAVNLDAITHITEHRGDEGAPQITLHFTSGGHLALHKEHNNLTFDQWIKLLKGEPTT